MKKTDLAYIGGLFDGEGWISVIKAKRINENKGYIFNNYSLRCGLGIRQEWIPRWLEFNFGGNVSVQHPQPLRADSWRWTIAANQALEFLKVITPFLKLKRTQAEIAMKFQTERPAHMGPYPVNPVVQEALDIVYKKMKLLNKRGVQSNEG